MSPLMNETVTEWQITDENTGNVVEVYMRQYGCQDYCYSTQAQAMGTLRKVLAAHLYKVSNVFQIPFPFSFYPLTFVLIQYA